MGLQEFCVAQASRAAAAFVEHHKIADADIITVSVNRWVGADIMLRDIKKCIRVAKQEFTWGGHISVKYEKGTKSDKISAILTVSPGLAVSFHGRADEVAELEAALEKIDKDQWSETAVAR